jgi:hypothetical protein
MLQPKTGEKCNCKRGTERDNCPDCEGTGMKIDFRKIREDAYTKTKHTPGPWKLGPGRTINTEGGEFYLSYGADPHGNPKWKASFSELDANARLIALAPEMADALRRIFVECALIHNRWGEESNQRKAEAVIARGMEIVRELE